MNVSFLEGKWRLVNLPFPAFQQWTLHEGGELEGVGFQTEPTGDTTTFEWFKIYREGGELFFYSKVQGADFLVENTMMATEITGKSVTFAADSVDFPSEIVYNVLSDRELVVSMSGVMEGKEQVFEFQMVKE